jgi:hypothetical protein
MPDTFNNFGYGILASSPGTGGTSATVITGDGDDFEEAIASDPSTHFNIVVWPAGTLPRKSNAEIWRVTNHVAASDAFAAFTRAQEGTSAKNVVAGYQFARAITAKAMTEAAPINLSQATPRADLQAAIDAVETTTKTVEIAPNLGELTFEDTTTITGYSGLKLKIGKDTTFLAAAGSTQHTMFDFSESATWSNLNANAAKKQLNVVLVGGGAASIGVAIGNYLLVTQNETSAAEGDSAFVTEIPLDGVTGDTVQLTEGLNEAFTTARSAKARKMTMLEKIRVEGLHLDGRLNSNVASHGLLTGQTAYCDFVDCLAEDFGGSGFYFAYGYANYFENVRALRSGGVAGAYASVDFVFQFNPRRFAKIESKDGTGFGVRIWGGSDIIGYDIKGIHNHSRNVKVHHTKRSNFFGGEASFGESSGLTPTGVAVDLNFFGWNCEKNDSNNLWWPAYSLASNIKIYSSRFRDSISAFDVATNAGITNLQMINCEYVTLDRDGTPPETNEQYIYGYIPVYPYSSGLVITAMGSLVAPHYEVADAAGKQIDFHPILLPEDYGSNLEFCFNIITAVANNDVYMIPYVYQQELGDATAPTILYFTGAGYNAPTVANKTKLLALACDVNTVLPSRLIYCGISVDRTNIADTNTGNLGLGNFFLRYRRR